MKFAVFAISFALCAQTPPKVPPGTPATPAPAPAAVAPDAVVVEIDGKKYTATEVDKLIASLPVQFQQAARMQPQTLGTYLMMKRLMAEAEQLGLDKQTPYKEQLEYNRIQALAQASLTNFSNHIGVNPDEQEQYYKNNPEKFRQAKVRVIYISFNPAAGKPPADDKKFLTEAEAKTKIEDLRKQILAGADFGKLARENSEDKTSAAKDGEFGIIKRSSSYPEPVKTAVFALKQGEVSQPVKQPNGFYLIRVDEWIKQPYDEVEKEIYQDLKQERFNEHMKKMQSQFQVKVENSSYFSAPPAGPPQLQQVR